MCSVHTAQQDIENRHRENERASARVPNGINRGTNSKSTWRYIAIAEQFRRTNKMGSPIPKHKNIIAYFDKPIFYSFDSIDSLSMSLSLSLCLCALFRFLILPVRHSFSFGLWNKSTMMKMETTFKRLHTISGLALSKSFTYHEYMQRLMTKKRKITKHKHTHKNKLIYRKPFRLIISIFNGLDGALWLIG